MGTRDQPHPPRTPRPDECGSAMHKVAAVVVVLLLGTGVAAWQGWIPGVDPDSLTSSDSTGTEPSDEPPPSGPGLSMSPPSPAGAVLDGVTEGGNVSPHDLERILGNAPRDNDLGKRYGLVVARLGSNRAPYHVGSSTVTPASTLKLLTSAAALQVMGPDHRFATRVVTGQGKRSIVLVGGGDPLLTDRPPTPDERAAAYPRQATLQDLARQTATALKQRGIRSVRLSYDVSLYAGPAVSPTWEPSYLPDDVVSPIVPLWVDEGRAVAGLSGRSADPANDAARRFATMLNRAGVKVVAPPAQHKAAATATEIARVESAPLAEIVEHVIELSDNEGAETLLRQTAIASGRPGSFSGGVAAVRTELGKLGVDAGGLRMYDGSGLSRQDRIKLATLLDVLQVASRPEHPTIRAVVSSLPVAGFTGSLAYRFVDNAPAGLGVVRAKTGTLTAAGVHGLAGIAVTRQGTALLFAEVADRVPLRKTLDARAQLDEIAARLSTCPC